MCVSISYHRCLDKDFADCNTLPHSSHWNVVGCLLSACLVIWNFSEYFECNTLWQISHGYCLCGAFACLEFSCRLRPSFWRNFMPHKSHSYGFSPVSIEIEKNVWKHSKRKHFDCHLRRRIWKVNDLLCVNPFSHTLHLNGRSPVWMNCSGNEIGKNYYQIGNSGVQSLLYHVWFQWAILCECPSTNGTHVRLVAIVRDHVPR